MVNPFAWKPCHYWPFCWHHRFVRMNGRWYCPKHSGLLRAVLPVVFVEPHLSVMNRRAEDYENGKLYRCVYCRKWFVHNDKHCAYGYCQECS